MKFPAYGRRLWDRRLSGQTPRVVCLLVGDRWTVPKWMPADVPRVAVKNAAWHDPLAERLDWRVVAACTVLAIDLRLPGERASGPEQWDSWLWLLADVQRYARDVLMFTPAETFRDPPNAFAAERCLEVYAWCSRAFIDGAWRWPPWWPYGDAIMARSSALERVAA